jgi:hypothetical protein
VEIHLNSLQGALVARTGRGEASGKAVKTQQEIIVERRNRPLDSPWEHWSQEVHSSGDMPQMVIELAEQDRVMVDSEYAYDEGHVRSSRARGGRRLC